MEVKVLGSQGGVAPHHRASSHLINGVLLLDAGTVASALPINEQAKINHILISHAHLDHIKDLAFMMDNCFGMRNVPFEICSTAPAQKAIQEHLFNDQIWPDFSKLPNAEKPTMRYRTLTPEKVVTLDGHLILPIPVNHPNGAVGFIIEKGSSAVLFTMDTGPTEKIWEYARKNPKLKAIFTEVSFPNHLTKVAKASQHHTPDSFREEMKKFPPNIPIYLSHLKPNFEKELRDQVAAIQKELPGTEGKRLHILPTYEGSGSLPTFQF